MNTFGHTHLTLVAVMRAVMLSPQTSIQTEGTYPVPVIDNIVLPLVL